MTTSSTVATYPATLPHDELVHLYRRMQGTTVVALLTDKRSPFRHIAPLLVNKLRIAAHDKIIVDFHNSTLIIGLHGSFSTTQDILSSCGKVFQHVIFNNVSGISERYNSYAQLFAQYLASQVSLDITTCNNYALVHLFVRKFKQVTGEAHLKVTRLKIQVDGGYSLERMEGVLSGDIKVFHYTSGDLNSLPSRWKLIGKSLEEVKMNITGNYYGYGYHLVPGWRTCIGELKEHARKLSSISLGQPLSYRLDDGNALTEAELVDFYMSYGTQLIELEIFDDLSPESLSSIVEQCPSVQLILRTKWNSFQQIPIVGRHLRELRLGLNYNEIAVGGFGAGFHPHIDSEHEVLLKQAIKKCDGLEKLTLSCLGVPPSSVVEAAFPINFKYLKHLTFSGSVLSPQSFTHVASVTSKLEYIKLSCHLPDCTTAIHAIARNNRGLRDVEICELPDWNYHSLRETAETALIIQQLVDSFSKCTMLKNITVKFMPDRSYIPSEKQLRRIVTPLRMKAVNFKFTFSPRERFFSTRIGRCKLVI